MRIARLVFGALAAVGLVLSGVVHFYTLVGVDPDDLFPPVWFLHVGVMVPFIAAGVAHKKAKTDGLIDHAPKWMVWMFGLFFAYGFVNCAILLLLILGIRSEGYPIKHDDGTYAITTLRGEMVRRINADEFRHYRAYKARWFSGGWMMFYCMSLTMLVSSSRYEKIKPSP